MRPLGFRPRQSPLLKNHFFSTRASCHAPHPNEDIITRLASQPQHPLSLSDLIRHGRPPLSTDALLASANFALSLIPIRLAHRIQALRSLPFIVVSNPHIKKIYDTYTASFHQLYSSTLSQISTLESEKEFTAALADLVAAHTDTIPILARGFLESKRYLPGDSVTAFLDSHLRARIGTRLIAEQHLALHHHTFNPPIPSSSTTTTTPDPYVGVINTALRPAQTVEMSSTFVGDICELRYGHRPTLEINGDPSATFAYVPMHLDYILTELLKNAFRATVENNPDHPIVVTIAPEPWNAGRATIDDGAASIVEPPRAIQRPDAPAPGVTIRIRDRGKGIPPDVLPSIWSYSFTTFEGARSDDDNSLVYGDEGLAAISNLGVGGSSLAGLGYGLPLSRAYAEYFGGGIQVESLFGWGTDVYLRLKGIGKIGVEKKTRA